ncbi:MAG: hypothetical protein BGP09_25105 [Rhizobium sp. 60-20]|jgi:hypothetical protein|nr:hypothetical protein [Rhizobium tropici]OJY72034.1 MAG: hypothetical protein BGP09_25105 [Rhizobium sp. 60-20]RKD35932.1 hypothetical protein BJ928_12711 [Rhizobium sp. WW_1]
MFGSSDPVAEALMAWASIGLVVAVAFLFFGFDKVDPGAHGAYAVRPLLVPGLVLLWPFVLWRWMRLAREGT